MGNKQKTIEIDIYEPDASDEGEWLNALSNPSRAVPLIPATMNFYLDGLREKMHNSTLSDADKHILIQSVQTMTSLIANVARLSHMISEQAPFVERINIRERFFVGGPIFFGSGACASFQVATMHELLDSAYSIQSGLQQGGLQGSEPDEPDEPEMIETERAKIRHIIKTIALSLDEKVNFE